MHIKNLFIILLLVMVVVNLLWIITMNLELKKEETANYQKFNVIIVGLSFWE